MRYLIDTFVFLKIIFGKTDDLSSSTLNIIDKAEVLYLSMASLWEIAIKYSIGKLNLKDNPEEWLCEIISEFGFKILPITETHVLGVISLPHIHKDPFDRLLISQSKLETIPLISPDKIFKKYKIERVW